MRTANMSLHALSRIRSIRLRSPLGRKLFLDLMVYFVLLAVLPALVIGYFTLDRARNQTIEQVTNQLGSVADLKRERLISWLDGNKYTLNTILADSSRYEAIVNLLTRNATSEDAAAMSRILSETVDANGFFGGFFLYDARGRIQAASEATEINKVVSRRPYFDASLQEPDHIQPPYLEVGRNQLVVIQTHPIIGRNNEVVGVLAGWLDTSALGAIMQERAGLGETGETYLVSLENNYFLTPSRFEGYPMNRAYKSEGIDQALMGKDGASIYLNYRGDRAGRE